MLKGILHFRHWHKIKLNVTKGEKSRIPLYYVYYFITTNKDGSLKQKRLF
jgi:hypothetical protein